MFFSARWEVTLNDDSKIQISDSQWLFLANLYVMNSGMSFSALGALCLVDVRSFWTFRGSEEDISLIEHRYTSTYTIGSRQNPSSLSDRAW